MNFRVNLVLLCVLLITKQCLTAKECVQRRLGACTVSEYLWLVDLNNPQPDHFLLKTSMEINLKENKHSFENYCLNEKKREVMYNLDNEAIVEISINGPKNFIYITLGQKYGRLAVLNYRNLDTYGSKYNRYSPILPTFPYYLHLQVTINGTFSIYADGNSEPFFEHQLTEPFDLTQMIINFKNPKHENDLIAFVDCSMELKPNSRPICGVRRVDKLYGCREWNVKTYLNSITNLSGFQKTYRKDVLFDEFIVIDLDADDAAADRFWSIDFNFPDHYVFIHFSKNFIKAILYYGVIITKSVVVERFEIPDNPYAVRVLLTTGDENTYLRIYNLRNNQILYLELCGVMGNIMALWFAGKKIYFDCLPSLDNINMSERPRKTIEMESNDIQYHENGYNYTKKLIDTHDFISRPFTVYQHDFGNSTIDWCPGERKPEVLETFKYNNDSLETLIERSNRELLTELKKNNAQNNATADINAAILTELKKLSTQNNATADINAAILGELKKVSAINDTNAAILTELKKLSAIADINAAELKVISDTFATHLEQNITAVNNTIISN